MVADGCIMNLFLFILLYSISITNVLASGNCTNEDCNPTTQSSANVADKLIPNDCPGTKCPKTAKRSRGHVQNSALLHLGIQVIEEWKRKIRKQLCNKKNNDLCKGKRCERLCNEILVNKPLKCNTVCPRGHYCIRGKCRKCSKGICLREIFAALRRKHRLPGLPNDYITLNQGQLRGYILGTNKVNSTADYKSKKCEDPTQDPANQTKTSVQNNSSETITEKLPGFTRIATNTQKKGQESIKISIYREKSSVGKLSNRTPNHTPLDSHVEFSGQNYTEKLYNNTKLTEHRTRDVGDTSSFNSSLYSTMPGYNSTRQKAGRDRPNNSTIPLRPLRNPGP